MTDNLELIAALAGTCAIALALTAVKRRTKRETSGTGQTQRDTTENVPAAELKDKAPKPKRKKVDEFGAHYYLGHLLDDLDDAFKHIPHLRKADREAFNLYRKLGATIMPERGGFSGSLDPHFLQALPSFGCAFTPSRYDGDETICPRFEYFIREKTPAFVQAAGGVVYRFGATFVDKKKRVSDMQMYCTIINGKVLPLKLLQPTQHKVGKNSFTRKEWCWPRGLCDWAAEKGVTPEQQAAFLFIACANRAYARESGLTVTVRKNTLAAVFAIDMLRTPYFFADREKTVNENGQTQRIIHIVRAHKRKTAGGGEKFVKSHFRGVSKFNWNGYRVSVGLAGKHGRGLSTFNLDAETDPRPSTRYVGTAETAGKLSEVLA